jgi:TetR/AcrR family transcriptional regulator, tetracycline repressor protein
VEDLVYGVDTAADGLAKFSMRRLGAALRVDPMAVYRHIEDQEALFDAIAEAVFDELDVASLPWGGTWREVSEAYCHRLRDALLRHPNAVTIFATRPIRSQTSIDTDIKMIRRQRDAGFPAAPGLQIIRCLREYTLGHALSVAVLRLGATARSRKLPPSPEDELSGDLTGQCTTGRIDLVHAHGELEFALADGYGQ